MTTLAPQAHRRLLGRPHRPLLATSLAAGVGLVVNVVDPNEPGSLGVCPFKLMTGGLDCPGCGVLRATRALTRGDVILAADHNLLFVLLTPLLLWGLIGWWRYERGWTPHRASPPAAVGYALAVITPLWWIGRNLPWLEWFASGLA